MYWKRRTQCVFEMSVCLWLSTRLLLLYASLLISVIKSLGQFANGGCPSEIISISVTLCYYQHLSLERLTT